MKREVVRLTGRFGYGWGYPRLMGGAGSYEPSDTLQHSNDAETSITDDAGPTKMKEIWVGVGCQNLKTKMEIKEVGGNASAQIYVNGVAVGANHEAGPGYSVKEDTIPVSFGEYIQVYGKAFGCTLYVKNFRVYGSLLEKDWDFKSTME